MRVVLIQLDLAAVAAQSFDIVLMDVHMPEMGGEELVRALRANPATASMPGWHAELNICIAPNLAAARVGTMPPPLVMSCREPMGARITGNFTFWPMMVPPVLCVLW